MMTSGLPLCSRCKVKTLDIAGLIDVEKTGETFSPERSSSNFMAVKDLEEWLLCFRGFINWIKIYYGLLAGI